LKKRTGPAAETLSSASDLSAFKEKSDVVVVGSFKNSDISKAFLSAASSLESIPFALIAPDVLDSVLSKDDKEALANNVDNVVIAYKKFDEGRVVFAEAGDQIDAEAIKTFVQGNSLPLVNEFKSDSRIFANPIRNHFFWFVDQKQDEAAIETLRQVSKDFKGRVIFTWIDLNTPGADRIAQFFSVKKSDSPQVRFFNLDSSRKYLPSTHVADLANWKDFVKSVLDGTHAPFFKSAEPVAHSGKGVRVLVGKDHDQIVNDPTKNVLVEYYAPWCGHCKKLAPIWDELAAEFDNDPEIVIAKMDSTENEVANVNIRGYPTLFFYPAGEKKSSLPYSGAREFADLKEFVTRSRAAVHHKKDEL